MMETTFEFADRAGDTLSLQPGDETLDATLTIREGSSVATVYVHPDDARALRDHLDEFLGEERKTSGASLDEAHALLIQVGKDLIRKGAPQLPEGGDVVVFLEPS
jgi:integrase